MHCGLCYKRCYWAGFRMVLEGTDDCLAAWWIFCQNWAVLVLRITLHLYCSAARTAFSGGWMLSMDNIWPCGASERAAFVNALGGDFRESLGKASSGSLMRFVASAGGWITVWGHHIVQPIRPHQGDPVQGFFRISYESFINYLLRRYSNT